MPDSGRKKSHGTKTVTLHRQLFSSIVFTTVIVFAVLVTSILISGILRRLDNNAFSTIVSMNSSRAEQTGQTLALKSRTLWEVRANIQNILDDLLEENGMAFSELQGDRETLDKILDGTYAYLERYLTAESVTGIFLVLETGYSENKHAAMYLRSSNPDGSDVSRSNIMLLWGSTRINSLQGLPLDQNWSMEYTMTGKLESDGFYNKPIEAYRQMPKTNISNLGYWCVMPAFIVDEMPILVYTVPLVSSAGEAAGVLGFEISYRQLSRILPTNDMPFGDNFYAMGQISDGGIVKETLASNGPLARAFFVGEPDIAVYEPVKTSKGQIWQIKGRPEMYFAYEQLELYGPLSIFKDNGWYMFAFAESAETQATSKYLTFALAATLAVALAVSFIVSYFVSRVISGKIEAAAAGVREMSLEARQMSLPRIHVREIDEMLGTIELMGASIANNAAKMSSIVDLMGLSIGVFEIDPDRGKVFMTKSMFRILEFGESSERWDGDAGYITMEAFNERLPQYMEAAAKNAKEKVFLYENGSDKKWLEMNIDKQSNAQGGRIYGAITDVSDRVREKERLIYESTYDTLTRLLNRKSYVDKIKELINADPDSMGVLAFIDMDLLKVVNDNYGHNMGDKYLQLAGSAFAIFERIGGVAARIAGDEFVGYIHGGASREELRSKVDACLAAARDRVLEISEDVTVKLTFSAGLAYYPTDSEEPESLVRYGDFAMYEVKQSSKGGTHEFNRFRYERDSAQLEKGSYISALFRERDVKYAFQPIVDLQTCDIAAYEAIMRPQSQGAGNYSPGEILALARSDGKLYELEHLLFNSFCRCVEENKTELKNINITFNSITDQFLSDEDFDFSFAELAETLKLQKMTVTMEMSAERFKDDDLHAAKISRAKKNNMLISLDDYTGGDIEKRIINEHTPDFVKIHIDVVRDIQISYNKQRLVREIVRLAAQNGAVVIAEGIETYRELVAVMNLGVRFGQGFYFCPPEFNLMKKLPDHIIAEIKTARQG